GQTLNIRRPELENHPAWPNLQPALKKAQPSDFCLITKGKEKKLLKFLAREKTLACLFFPEDDLHRDPDYIRQQALSHAWHVLNAPPPGAGVIRANYKDETTLAWHNMLADAFGARVMEMQGKRGFIKALARRRSALALDPHAGYRPELYPYPVVMDAAQLV